MNLLLVTLLGENGNMCTVLSDSSFLKLSRQENVTDVIEVFNN